MTKAVDAIQRPQELAREPKQKQPRLAQQQKKARAAAKRAAAAVESISRPRPARTKLYLAVGLSFAALLVLWATTFRWSKDDEGDTLFQSIVHRFQNVFTSEEEGPTVLENGTVMGASEELQQLKDRVFPQFTDNGQ